MDVGTESGQVLCRALGLDPFHVQAITIHWRAGEMPYAAVEMLLNEQAVYEIIQLEPKVQP